jgi:hypothetical protein
MIARNSAAYRYDDPNLRVAILEVRFRDGTVWRADVDGM